MKTMSPESPESNLTVVPVQFETSTGSVHLDQTIEHAAEIAMGKVKRMLVSEMVSAMKAALEANDKYPAPRPGSVLNRGTAVDKVCLCGRTVTFPLTAERTSHEP
jgi:hypothetical protein